MKIVLFIANLLGGVFFLCFSIVGIYNYHIKSDMFINEPTLLILLILQLLVSICWIVNSLFPKRVHKWVWGGDDRKFF